MKLTIANTGIHQDAEGRFSLNDLHKAAVEAGHDYKTCQVEHFMRNDKTQELADEIRKNGELEIDPVASRAGRYGGTYVAKELVYAYAMWISPKFHLQVIRTFDAVATGKVGAGETAKALPNPVGTTRAHLMVVSAMEKMGVRKEMAMAVALQAIHDDTGLTTEGYRLALPGVEDVCNLNQKQLGELLGVSSKAVGNLLRNTGLMVIDEAGQRVVTEKGRQFGEMKPFKAFNGHAGYEPRWNKSVLEFFAQQAKEAA
jgi:hypothetical protein